MKNAPDIFQGSYTSVPSPPRLGIVSSVNAPADAEALFAALGKVIEIIRKHVDPQIVIECCAQTLTELLLLSAALDQELEIRILSPALPALLIQQIPDNMPSLEKAKDYLSDPAHLFVIDESKNFVLGADLTAPTTGQQIVARDCDILFVVAKDIKAAHQWANSLRQEFAFRHGFVIVAAEDDSPAVVDFSKNETNSAPLDELSVRLLRAVDTVGEEFDDDFTEGPGFSLGGISSAILALISWKWPKQWYFHFSTSEEWAEDALRWPNELETLPPSDKAELEELHRRLSLPFAWADLWAVHYGNLTRTIAFLLLLLNISAVAFAILSYVDHARTNRWDLCEFIALVLIALVFLLGRHYRIHQRWVQYRLLAEFIRPTQYFWAFVAMYNPVSPDVQARESDWWEATIRVYRSIVRRIGSPRVHMTASYRYLMTVVLKEFIRSQYDWHSTFAARHFIYHARLVRSARLAYWCVLTAAIAHLAVERLPLAMSWQMETMLANTFLAIACVLAVAGFGLGVIIHQLGFDHIAERSEQVAARLRILLDRMELHHGPWSPDLIRQLLGEFGEIIVNEQNAWFRQTSKIAIHL